MKGALAHADTDARERGIQPRLVSVVQEISNFEQKIDIIFVISNTHLDVYDKEGKKLQESLSWFFLSHIDFTGYNLQMDFKTKKYSCVSTEINTIYGLISDIVQRVLKSSELRNIGFKKNVYNLAFPTGFSALLRLKERAKAKNLKITSNIINIFQNILMYNENTISLSHFDNSITALPFFIDLLPLCRNISIVHLPKLSGIDIYDQLSLLAKEESSIECFDIEGSATPAFDSFLKNIENNPGVNLDGLVFHGAKFDARHIEKLTHTIIKKKITSVTFNKSFETSGLKSFYSTLLKDAGHMLTVLSVTKSSGIKPQILLPMIPNIMMLSLEHCELDIARTLTAVSKADLKNLKALNLSGNICSSAIAMRPVRIVGSLESLMVNDIKWEDGTLVAFFDSLVYNFRNGLRLSISNITASQNEFNEVFQMLQKTRFSALKSLIWNRNPTPPAFFDFLRKNASLRYLSLNECFSEDCPDPIMMLISYISASPNLHTLNIKGGHKINFGRYTNAVINAVSGSELVELDISGSKCGDNGIRAMKDLLQSPLSLLVMDGAEPQTPELFIKFLESAYSTRQDFLSFPASDFDFLVSRRKIDKASLPSIVANFQGGGTPGQPLDPPFYVFKDSQPPDFPLYLSPGNNNSSIKSEDIMAHGSPRAIQSPKRSPSPPPRRAYQQNSKRLFELSNGRTERIRTTERIEPIITLDAAPSPRKTKRGFDVRKRRSMYVMASEFIEANNSEDVKKERDSIIATAGGDGPPRGRDRKVIISGLAESAQRHKRRAESPVSPRPNRLDGRSSIKMEKTFDFFPEETAINDQNNINSNKDDRLNDQNDRNLIPKRRKKRSETPSSPRTRKIASQMIQSGAIKINLKPNEKSLDVFPEVVLIQGTESESLSGEERPMRTMQPIVRFAPAPKKDKSDEEVGVPPKDIPTNVGIHKKKKRKKHHSQFAIYEKMDWSFPVLDVYPLEEEMEPEERWASTDTEFSFDNAFDTVRLMPPYTPAKKPMPVHHATK